MSRDDLKIYNSEDNTLISQYKTDMQFNDYISVNIFADCRGHAMCEVSSKEEKKEFNIAWSARKGAIFVTTDDNTILGKCQLSYYCNGWSKPIWLFGDSYFNCTHSDRWTSYLTEKGSKKYLLSGFPGRTSDEALISLKTMLRYATPNEIIWCMGMNDGDTDKINSNFQEDVEQVMDICNELNVELVLATIPNCPTVDNRYKNKYVIESGYRFIDFASSVGADIGPNWYEGMLGDGCHPTDIGALALYNKAVATCPELIN